MKVNVVVQVDASGVDVAASYVAEKMAEQAPERYAGGGKPLLIRERRVIEAKEVKK